MIFYWFRRDLRLDDNAALYHALKSGQPVIPVFIFDTDILGKLENSDDARVSFLHETVSALKSELQELGSDLIVRHGKPLQVWKDLIKSFPAKAVYLNHDYEPAAIKRDHAVEKLFRSLSLEYHSFKDQVIFEKSEIVTEARKPYTVYTPYKKKWMAGLSDFYLQSYPTLKYKTHLHRFPRQEGLLDLSELGFTRSNLEFPESRVKLKILKNYAETRDYPALEEGTTRLGIHLRFGTRSVRELARAGKEHSPVWLSELAWREFFMQVLFHFPRIENESFRTEFEKVAWRKNSSDFERWKSGQTGYPMVDAGMRQMNATGFMHNRVRMVTASFLCKHLLIYWLEGERYFASKLLDYELAANNGNWQWAAGTGCDAAPYFRIFNPESQQERFDKSFEYIRKWVPEYGTSRYPKPIVDHRFARERALAAFKAAAKVKER